ncbi:XRE family transcriptional regulator [Cryobacterium sp. Hh7]|uniref:helix-turn-helix domain-containing protein n=1 Tax=Cryobacterium sp. Hh7 TaxID=1259159 RepID=UPI00106D83C9|nr:helix-turn-helix transcriptional regulator [Cryobacterium sp. Hh7]TFD61089.1 XRE family transcriptional regulator [Cryobacterium sp. Hh7]
MAKGTKPTPGPLTQEVSSILRAEMARHRILQGQLAAATGISTTQLSEILNGKKNIDIQQLDALCWSLGLDFTAVIRDAEQQSEARHLAADWTATPLT